MTPSDLGQYLRAFLVKLCMLESQLGPLSEGVNAQLQSNFLRL